MAGLEKATKDGRDSWKLRIYLNGRREKIGLGGIEESSAQDAKAHVEHLVEMARKQRPPDPKTTRWLDLQSAELHGRLAELGLVEPRSIQEHPRTVIKYMRAYIRSRTDWKKSVNHKQSVDHLEKYLGRDVALRAFNKGEAERFHRWMTNEQGLSPNTAGQHIKRCRQMMRSALNDKLIEENPFQDVKIVLRSDKSKNRFIDGPSALALLEACPDQEWRVIFALARFGGLRCPSELLALRWSDVNWDRNRFKVHSSKTKKAGKGERIVPLFPELRQELDLLWQLVQPGVLIASNSHVIQSYRCTEVNLRKTMHKIADIAGIERWPKPFIALRASRRTELERSRRHANHVLNDWFGHTEKVADEFYLQVTEDDFDDAIRSGGLLGGPSLGEQGPPREIAKRKNPAKSRVPVASDAPLGTYQYTHLDSNQKPSVP
jgi:integrase